MTSSEVWGEDTARRYDAASVEMFAPEVLGPTVDLLERLAGGGDVLELAIGTGRVAVPLHERGLRVSGIELSAPMVAQLRTKVGERDLPVAIGDMATARVPGEFTLVFLAWNSLSNLRTQDEQVACFANAARHLRPGGRFVLDLWVPRPPRPGESVAVPMSDDGAHAVVDTYDDPTAQQVTSHHTWTAPDGTVSRSSGSFRYAWPAELDLMARLAGLEPEARYGGWDRRPFTADSDVHVSVWRRPT